MKLFLFIFILSLPSFAAMNERLGNLVGMLTSTPASLTGDIAVGSDVLLGQSRIPIGPIQAQASVTLRKNIPMGFRISEESLSLDTNKAVVLKVAGIVFKIKSITYNKNGHFTVDTDSPVLEKTLERKIAAAIETRFKGKMDLAFRQLSAIRHQKSTRDAKMVINGIMDIFKEPGNGPGLFDNVTLSGNVNLNFDFQRRQTLQVTDQYVADIQAGDQISAGGRFTRRAGRYNITEIEFSSYKGVVLRPENKSDLAMGALRVTSVRISDRGIEPTMVTGAEETITGITQLIALISSAQGAGALAGNADCDPRVPGIQQYLQKQLNGQLIPLIRQHRTALIEAGISPRVLQALEG